MERTLKSIEEPILREWELNENSTRWDWLVVSASDEGLMRNWIALLVTTTFVTLVVGTIMTAILIKKKTRRLAFNMYLVGLMIPDFVFSFVCAITCSLCLSVGHYYSASLCQAQSFFIQFGIAGNAWMTVVILRQLLKLLTCAKQCKRYQPPSMSSVLTQCGIAFLWSAFVSTWGLLPESWGIPHKTQSSNGFACFPLDYDVASSLIFFLVFFPALSGIPIGYTMFVIYKIWRGELMPKRGHGKLIAVYLLRIVVCLFGWWVPSIFFLLIYPNVPLEANIFFSVWMHFQGAASALLMLSKPDIMKATKELLCCQPCRESCHCPSRSPASASTEMPIHESLGGVSHVGIPTLVTDETNNFGWDGDDNDSEKESEIEERLESQAARELEDVANIQ